jgi:hypothetical protein
MKKLPWSWFDHRTDLPKWILRGIGQVTVEWSVLERELEETIRLLMDVTLQNGRIITNRMNVKTRIALIENLLQARIYSSQIDPQINVGFSNFGRTIAEKLESKRNMLIHGLWDRHEGKWHVLRLAAKRPTPALEPDIPHLSRAVVPQREVITAKKLRSITREIVSASKKIERLCKQISASLPASQHKPPEYTRRRSRYHT